MLIAAIFSFGPDALAANACARAVRNSGVDDVVVFSDVKDPVGGGPYHVVPTEFNRGGNLNGAECITAMLRHMLDATRSFGATGCFKIDSDTVVRDISWHEIGDAVGFELVPYHFSGSCYYLSLEGLTRLVALFEARRGSYAGGFALPEDQTISAAAALFIPKTILIPWNTGKLGGYPLNGSVPYSIFDGCAVVSFGQRSTIPEARLLEVSRELGVSSDVAARRIVGNEMINYLDHEKNRINGGGARDCDIRGV